FTAKSTTATRVGRGRPVAVVEPSGFTEAGAHATIASAAATSASTRALACPLAFRMIRPPAFTSASLRGFGRTPRERYAAARDPHEPFDAGTIFAFIGSLPCRPRRRP